MTGINNLQKALLILEVEKAHTIDDVSEAHETHVFSRRYNKRRKEIIETCADNSFESGISGTNYKRSHRLKLRTILVAALILLLATITVIAMTKPHIYYVIKDKLESWDILFIEEGSEREEGEFVAVKPEIPDGFTIVEEDELAVEYYLALENSTGETIDYDQVLPEGTTISIDSEHSENSTEIINGTEVIVSRGGDTVLLICNDGEYIYEIFGNADEKLLRQMMMSIIEN